jgi:hypothetical protein
MISEIKENKGINENLLNVNLANYSAKGIQVSNILEKKDSPTLTAHFRLANVRLSSARLGISLKFIVAVKILQTLG